MGEMFFFFFFSALIIIGAIVILVSTNLLHVIFSLFSVLLGVGGLYALLYAPFLLAVQLIVYAGGVNVLILFATMLTKKIEQLANSTSSSHWRSGIIIIAGFFGIVLFFLQKMAWPTISLIPQEVLPSVLGLHFLQGYVWAFELVSFVLLAALIGGLLLITKRD